MPTMQTQVRARWQARMVLLVAAFALFALWMAYDGAFAYPAHNRRAAAYNALVVEEERPADWEALARSEGWPLWFAPEDLAPDGRAKPRSEFEIGRQLALGTVCFVVAMLLGVRLFQQRRHIVRLDEEGLLLLGSGRRVSREHMVDLDMRRWASQGLAVLRYTDRLGRWRRLVLDDGIQQGVAEILEQLDNLPEAGEKD